MCECGCGDLRPFGKFPAPNGDTYLLEIYPGCGDCHVGPGVVVHRFTTEQLEEHGWTDFREIPDLPWLPDRAECAVPVLDLNVFRRTFEDEAGEEAFYAVSNIGALLRSAVARTLAEFNKAAR